MLYARAEPLRRFVDKLAVREFVAQCVGPEYLIPLIWTGNDASDLPVHDLPKQFVIKPNHASRWIAIVSNTADTPWPDIVRTCNSWLKTCFAQITNERIYKGIRPTLMVEPLLADPASLVDYKFLCFDGDPLFVDVHAMRFVRHCEDIYDRDWNWVPARWGPPNCAQRVARPGRLNEMLGVARALSRGFSFVRVDLYEVNGRVYFGELTFFPGAARDPIVPVRFDYELGKYLRVERDMVKH